jgi:hypothetical protein
VVDYIHHWTERSELPAKRLLGWLDLREGKFYDWKNRYGKTTIARLIAGELADEMNVEEVDATDLSAARIRDIERESVCKGLGEKPGRANIVNEAHGLNRGAVRQLLTTLERIPPHVVWIFTTTIDGHPVDADRGGCWEYVNAYAKDAGIDAVTACNRVLKRTCDAVALILDEAERLQAGAAHGQETGLCAVA